MSAPQSFVKVGDTVAVTFLDHAEKSDTLLRFVAYGRVAIITPNSITLDSWHYAGDEARDSNVERYTLATQVIEQIELLGWRAAWRKGIDT